MTDNDIRVELNQSLLSSPSPSPSPSPSGTAVEQLESSNTSNTSNTGQPTRRSKHKASKLVWSIVTVVALVFNWLDGFPWIHSALYWILYPIAFMWFHFRVVYVLYDRLILRGWVQHHGVPTGPSVSATTTIFVVLGCTSTILGVAVLHVGHLVCSSQRLGSRVQSDTTADDDSDVFMCSYLPLYWTGLCFLAAAAHFLVAVGWRAYLHWTLPSLG